MSDPYNLSANEWLRRSNKVAIVVAAAFVLFGVGLGVMAVYFFDKADRCFLP